MLSYCLFFHCGGFFSSVLADVGCNRPKLDLHDQRILGEVTSGICSYSGSITGLPGLPDSQQDVGGWEDYPVVRRPDRWDTDGDGMPDQREKLQGLDASDAGDENVDTNGDG